MKKNCMIRIDKNTNDRLKLFKRELGLIEKNDLAIGEIISRMVKGEDMLPRLKKGSIERRRGIC